MNNTTAGQSTTAQDPLAGLTRWVDPKKLKEKEPVSVRVGPSLRPHQTELVADIKVSLLTGGPILAVSPTGSGKTITFCHIAARALEKGSRVLIIAPRRELVYQIHGSLVLSGIDSLDIGIIMAGERGNPRAPIQVAIINTLHLSLIHI